MSDTLRVVILNNLAGDDVGRYRLRTLPVIAGLVADGAEVGVVAQSDSAFAAESARLGAHVRTLSMSRLRAPRIVAALAEECDYLGARIVTGTGYFTNMLVRQGSPATMLTVNEATRLAHRPHEYLGGGIDLSGAHVPTLRARDRADAYIANSQATARALESYGIPAQSITRIPTGIDATTFALESQGDCLQLAHRDVRRPLVLAIARNLDEASGMDLLIEAAALLKKANAAETPQIAIIGAGPEYRILERRIAERDLAHDVLLSGFVDHPAPLYAAAQLVVMPSREQAFPVIALEAYACSKPVIATAVDGNSEVVCDGTNGILVPALNVEALAQAIADLLENAPLRKRYGDAGHALVMQQYTQHEMVERTLTFYHTLAEKLG